LTCVLRATSGTNWLDFDDVNQGGPAGLIFSADIRYVPSTVATPEPSSCSCSAPASSASGLCYGVVSGGC